MTLSVKWHPAAVAALYRLPWRLAARVDSAILTLAATGAGDLRHVGGPEFRLHVDAVRVRLTLDRPARILYVTGLYVYA